MDQSLILGQDIELIWAVWFIKIFDISISQEYALKILRSHNELAMIIMFDILRWSGLNEKPAIKKEYKAILNMLKQEDVDEDGNADHLPWSSHWMLAYELELQNVFSCISETLGIMSNNPYFKKLLKKNIKFYDPLFSYSDEKLKDNRKKDKQIAIIDAYLKVTDHPKESEKENKDAKNQLIKMFEEVMDSY